MTVDSEAAALAYLLDKVAPQPATPQPLGHIRDDPSWAAAEQARQRYDQAVIAARNDSTTSRIGAAAAVTRAHRAATAAISAARQDLRGRRQARLEWLDEQLPLGPGVPIGATAADRAVLQAGFTAALALARTASPAARQKMLAEAERFGDDLTRRAVFTAALDTSDHKTLESWTQQYAPQTGAHLEERKQLRMLQDGYTGSTEYLFERQGFVVPPVPDEATELPRLVDEHNKAVYAHNLSKVRSPGWTARQPVDLETLLNPAATIAA
ncbi:hypothetical protein [Actinoplanes sp. NPDC051859]|uniref:hypothetical protein n=1 Tax=Actinoplanes sp. NPDC051859 TaxID=3363909 RepID=UPI0037B6EC8C